MARSTSPRMTSKFSRNLSFSSRCHWKVRLAGATISVRLTRPRAFSSLSSKPGHDRLAGAGVVGEQEPDARQLEEVVVDRFELVRQRIDAGDGEREVRVVLVGQAEPLGLDAEAEQRRVAVERLARRGNLQLCQVVLCQDGIPDEAAR